MFGGLSRARFADQDHIRRKAVLRTDDEQPGALAYGVAQIALQIPPEPTLEIVQPESRVAQRSAWIAGRQVPEPGDQCAGLRPECYDRERGAETRVGRLEHFGRDEDAGAGGIQSPGDLGG